MKFVIESGTHADIDELEKLYDDLNDLFPQDFGMIHESKSVFL